MMMNDRAVSRDNAAENNNDTCKRPRYTCNGDSYSESSTDTNAKGGIAITKKTRPFMCSQCAHTVPEQYGKPYLNKKEEWLCTEVHCTCGSIHVQCPNCSFTFLCNKTKISNGASNIKNKHGKQCEALPDEENGDAHVNENGVREDDNDDVFGIGDDNDVFYEANESFHSDDQDKTMDEVKVPDGGLDSYSSLFPNNTPFLSFI